MSQFIEDLLRPHVLDTALDSGYQAMAADLEREADALEWCNALAMADQIMAADKVRLKSRVGMLSKKDLEAVESTIKVHLALPL
jgi:mRNA-degrading endonuclease toxin of MazEF toxin-antitoxin module